MESPNLTFIKELSGGDVLFEKKLIGIIKLEFPQEKALYFENFNQNKYSSTADCVHKIKHKISIFGLDEGYKKAGEHENNLIKKNTSLSHEFEAILDNITKYLNQI